MWKQDVEDMDSLLQEGQELLVSRAGVLSPLLLAPVWSSESSHVGAPGSP